LNKILHFVYEQESNVIAPPSSPGCSDHLETSLLNFGWTSAEVREPVRLHRSCSKPHCCC